MAFIMPNVTEDDARVSGTAVISLNDVMEIFSDSSLLMVSDEWSEVLAKCVSTAHFFRSVNTSHRRKH